jgi:glutamate-1-semialdehyde 2,1-aminomutase
MLAADAFLDEVAQPAFWTHLEDLEQVLYPGLRQAFASAGLPVWVQAVGARFSLLFGLDSEPTTYRQAALYDRDLSLRFFRAALEEGVYFHSAWHHGICSMHTRADLEEALNGIETAARRVARNVA